MEAQRPAPLPPPKAAKACPSCKDPVEVGRLLQCPRCHLTHHLECVWDRSRCPCGYDLEDEARHLGLVWAERSLRWFLGLPGRWAARSRDGLVEQRRSYGSLWASSTLLTAACLILLWALSQWWGSANLV